MKPSIRKYLLGILIVMAGAAVLEYAIVKTPAHTRPNPSITIPGFIIVAIGAWVIFQWSRQRQARRDQ